jgi:TRAP-type C4-dicarboxylate transport system permease small subunit
MIDPQQTHRLHPTLAAVIAVIGVAVGLFIALYMFIQLRSAWMEGVVAFGIEEGPWDFDYETQPFAYILAMSALFPAGIVCGAALAVASAFAFMRQRARLLPENKKKAPR